MPQKSRYILKGHIRVLVLLY